MMASMAQLHSLSTNNRRNTQFQKVEVCFDDSSSHLKYQLGADDRPPRKKSKFLETTDST